MNATARIQPRGQVTIPTRLRAQAGLSKGDLVELAFERGRIVIKPRGVIDKSQFLNADDEYTPAQRRVIDARLAKGMAEIKAGRTYGPFNCAAEMIADMKARLKKKAAPKPARRVR
jgi:AbrB family looped-hinge helix DNA binding protein